MRRRTLTLGLIAAAVFLSACGGVEDTIWQSQELTSPTRLEQEAAGVTVVATFNPADPSVIDIAFDTHSVDLDFDVAASSTLTVDGEGVPSGTWAGSGPGGHHRQGSLSFPAAPTSGETMTLTITGLPEPVTFTWAMP